MLTQDNLVSNVKAGLKVLPLDETDIALSALPYSHVFERMVAHYLYPAAGVSIAIAGSLDEVAQNLGEIRPTVMTMVPRFYEKLYARVNESVDKGSQGKKKIFHWAIGVGGEHGKYRLAGKSASFGLELKIQDRERPRLQETPGPHRRPAALFRLRRCAARQGDRRFLLGGGYHDCRGLWFNRGRRPSFP